jgi:GDP-L-fucose synthase
MTERGDAPAPASRRGERVQFSLAGRRVFVAGHRGMVGSALCRRLAREAGVTVLTAARRELDLARQRDVEAWFAAQRPDAVLLAAAKVGGILANDTQPAAFMYENLVIATNVIEAARRFGARKLLFLGSSCIYPRLAPQPMAEDSLLEGALEPTNQWYAIAKIAGLKLCEAYRRQWGCDFISAMPTNLYGPNDNFDPETSHALAALIRKIHLAKVADAPTVTLWGSGRPRREFLHVDDLADACVFLMKTYSGAQHVNVGMGEDLTILELAETIARIVGYRGRFEFDSSKPDGTPRKLLDISQLRALGWRPRIDLVSGLSSTYRWYLGSIAGGGRVEPARHPNAAAPPSDSSLVPLVAAEHRGPR